VWGCDLREGEMRLGRSMVSCSIDVVLVLDELREYDILDRHGKDIVSTELLQIDTDEIILWHEI
jgi:hypothetical protein